ncbi:MAG TPA: OsmC family protein [Conexivisphaerales archaeon]|nr:OsmC family protein [Conexivisphaerales archaeon]
MVDPTSVNVRWVEGYTFIASNEDGYSLLMDAKTDDADTQVAMSPAQTLLASVGGCTGIDIVSILKKMRQDVRGLSIQVTGDRTPGYPKYFQEVHVKYIVEGKGLEKSAVERAIALSTEKYCTVSNTINGKAKVGHSYEIVEVK